MIVLSLCMALQMTSYVMIQPLFARRFSEFGAGVESLGASAMAYAVAATLAAPFMGALSDRLGRRRLVLVSLAAYVLAFIGFLLASSAPAFIVLRALTGVFTAGLIPAVIGIAADLAPRERRAQWISIVNGGASVGWMAGPVLGGVLYDRWGYGTALGVSIFLALTTFLMALLMVPETRRNLGNPARGAMQEERQFQPESSKSSRSSFWETLPASISKFAGLLWVCFTVTFAYTFIEPRFMFYAYGDLGWKASMLGLAMSAYGIAMTVGEFGLGQLSDRLGRKPVIVLGLALFSAQFIGLTVFSHFLLIAVTFAIAGLGNALYDPALSAAILDIAPAKHQTRLLSLKSAVGSLGNILGPALVVVFTSSLEARSIFLIAVGMVLLTALMIMLCPIGVLSSKAVFVSGTSEGQGAGRSSSQPALRQPFEPNVSSFEDPIRSKAVHDATPSSSEF